MSFTKQAVKRLEREVNRLDPEKNYPHFAMCLQDPDTQLFKIDGNGRAYKTIDELKSGEKLKPDQGLIIISTQDDRGRR